MSCGVKFSEWCKCSKWFRWWPLNRLLSQVFQDVLEKPKCSQCFSKVFQNLSKFLRIPLNIPNFLILFQNLLNFWKWLKIYTHFSTFSRVFRNNLKFSEISRNFSRFDEIKILAEERWVLFRFYYVIRLSRTFCTGSRYQKYFHKHATVWETKWHGFAFPLSRDKVFNLILRG